MIHLSDTDSLENFNLTHFFKSGTLQKFIKLDGIAATFVCNFSLSKINTNVMYKCNFKNTLINTAVMPNLVLVMPQEPLQEPENMSCKDSLVKWLWVTFGHSEHLDT
jgi:hypothetical protein